MLAQSLLVPEYESPESHAVDEQTPAMLTNNPRHSGSTLLAFLKRPISALVTAIAAVFMVYAPSLNGQFLWDDTLLVKNNLLIRSPLFVLEVFKHTLFGDESNFYRPTQTLTFLADYWFWGLNPFGYHLTSVFIHVANTFLLCLVLRRVLPTLLTHGSDQRFVDRIALGVALIWAVHPVHSAAVAYISGTADTLAMTCCLLGVLSCEQALSTGRSSVGVGYAAGAFACLLLGLCAKEIASIWLALYLGYLFGLRKETSSRQRWSVVVFAVAALLVYLGLRHLPPPPAPPPPFPKMPPKWLLMLRALGDYGSLLLFPDKLFMERQVFAAPGLANAPDEVFYTSLAVSGAAMLLAFAAGAWWPGRGQRLRRVGAIWFLVGFLPISNLFPLNASVAEHWLYLPSIGFILCMVGAGLDLVPRLNARGMAPVLTLLLGLIIVALGLRTWYRTFDWLDETTFFRQTIADGGDVVRARANLGVAYSHQAIADGKLGADDQVAAMLRDLVHRYPRVVGPRINLANSLARHGDLAGARTILEALAADFFGGLTGDSHELVTTLRSLDILEADNPGWPPRRAALLQRGFHRFPDAWELVDYDVQERARTGHPAEALAAVRHYADTHWWQAPARVEVGQLEAGQGHTTEALAAWIEASRLDVHDAEALSNAAMLCLNKGQPRDACDFQSRAVRRQPDSPRLHVLLARALDANGDHRLAQAQIALAQSLVDEAAQP